MAGCCRETEYQYRFAPIDKGRLKFLHNVFEIRILCKDNGKVNGLKSSLNAQKSCADVLFWQGVQGRVHGNLFYFKRCRFGGSFQMAFQKRREVC
mgnify:CR=1 FL=1